MKTILVSIYNSEMKALGLQISTIKKLLELLIEKIEEIHLLFLGIMI